MKKLTTTQQSLAGLTLAALFSVSQVAFGSALMSGTGNQALLDVHRDMDKRTQHTKVADHRTYAPVKVYKHKVKYVKRSRHHPRYKKKVIVVKKPYYTRYVSPYAYYSPYRHHYRYYSSSYPYYGPYYHFYPRYRTYDNSFSMYTTGAYFPRYYWRRASYGRTPHRAVLSTYWHGRPAYKCKAHYRRALRYGRVGARGCYINYKNRIIVLKQYRVMVRR